MLAHSQDFKPLVRTKRINGMSIDTFGYMKAYLNRGVIFKLQIFPYIACILHAAPGGCPSHVSTGLSPIIPSLCLSKGWRPVLLTEWVSALLFKYSSTPCFFEILRMSQHSIK